MNPDYTIDPILDNIIVLGAEARLAKKPATANPYMDDARAKAWAAGWLRPQFYINID